MPRKNLTDKLERFRSQITARPKSNPPLRYPERYQLLADVLGGELVQSSAGCFCLIRTNYTVGHTHGLCELNVEAEEKFFPAAAFSAHENSLNLSLGSMMFLDTETTGLGGSGTVAFLIGIGSYTENGFEICQYLIPDYSDEAAMLQEVHSSLNAESTIVSFNGASFDLPVLQDRLIINRIARKLDFHYHLDLLHPARRLFKRRLQDCTLINLERQLFSFYRSDDIPGYLVPSVYFEWLSTQELSRMKAVLEHNRYDIISLYFLTGCIAKAYESSGGTLEHPEDLHSLSRFFERRKESHKIEGVYQRVKEMGNGITPDAALHYARNFKRTQNFEQSVKIWESMAGDKTAESFWACVELAKYYEHQAKEFKTALEFTELAYKCDSMTDRQMKILDRRANRLAKKLVQANEN